MAVAYSFTDKMPILKQTSNSRRLTSAELLGYRQGSMGFQVLNPLEDQRWGEFVARHPQASVFHQRGWLEALARTYSYEPFVLTTASGSEPLGDGIALCRVSSWITGARAVSLPFSDHCEPLVSDSQQPEEFVRWAKDACGGRGWKYAEIRPLHSAWDSIIELQKSGSYWFHELDLGPDVDQLFGKLHKNSFQRKIQRAGREGVECEVGRSAELLNEFFALLQVTRKRHELLPQPKAWFQNLVECLGENLQIRVARRDRRALAAILTLRHGTTVVYKYGCSDERFHSLGAMPLLFWQLIEESKASGAQKIDFGRTDLDNAGLMTFKDRLGATKSALTYYRYAEATRRNAASLSDSRALRRFFSILPEMVRAAAGRVLYRHLG